MSLSLRKNDGESWEDAARRYAKKYDLEEEVMEAYHGYVKNGDSEQAAAWVACYDWDILDYEGE